MEGLNLRKISLKSDTYDFYTRIYPIGKDGITPEWLTGKDYIDNFQYSSKIKAYVWKDERYTNTTSLIEDATAKIEEMSRPYKAYTAEVVDLAKASEEYKDILSYGIGDTVTLVSKKTRTKEKQRIVKITEYPESPEKNTVEISNARKTFAEIQKEETAAATEEAVSISNRVTKKVLENYSTTEDIETKITASKEAIELGVMHTLESYYDKTETDALINASKGEIELNVSQTYQTKTEMGEYSTTEETKALIDITTESITQEVSKKVGKDEIISKINQSAEEIKISAKKINIEGTITVEDLAENSGIARQEDIPQKIGELENDLKFIDSATATKITKNTVTTQYINSLKIKAGSVDAENIVGTTLSGLNFVSKKRTKIDEDVFGIFIGESGFDFCWNASNEWDAGTIYGHLRMTNTVLQIIIGGESVFAVSSAARYNGANIGVHATIPTLICNNIINE